ncbi:MAG: DUF1993 domain-containing protein [Novosphingobium sp.]|nr:DUF1993 domain-containing protein [Novosphingobium sp.]
MNYADFTFATFRNMLGMLDDLFVKTQAAGFGDDLLRARLAEDMFDLGHQVTVLGWQVDNMLSRCAGKASNLNEVDPVTLAEAREHLAAVAARLDGVSGTDCLQEDAVVDFDLPFGAGFVLSAGEYARDWALPQFYFHVMAIYAIMRSQGVEIGKRDYIPYMMPRLKPGSTLSPRS